VLTLQTVIVTKITCTIHNKITDLHFLTHISAMEILKIASIFFQLFQITTGITSSEWYKPSKIDRILSPSKSCDFDVYYPKDQFTKEIFEKKYFNKRPLLLRGYGNAFKKSQNISKRKQILKKFGKLFVDVGTSSSNIVEERGRGEKQEILSAFLKDSRKKRIDKTNGENRYVFFNLHLQRNTTHVYKKALRLIDEFRSQLILPLDNAFEDPTYSTTNTAPCSASDQSCIAPSSKFSYYFLLGRSESGVNFHSHGSGWNILLAGEKSWRVYSPGSLEPGRSFWKGHLHWLKHVLPLYEFKPSHCRQVAGDVLYIPSSYLHAVVNLGETFGLAVQLNIETNMLGTLEAEVSKAFGSYEGGNDLASYNKRVLNALSNIISYHEKHVTNPNPAHKCFLSGMYSSRSKIYKESKMFLRSIVDADKAKELNNENLEAHLLYAMNAGLIENRSVTMERLYMLSKTAPDFVPGAKELAIHLLTNLSNMTKNEKLKYYVDVLETLSKTMQSLKVKASKVNNPVPVLDDLITLTNLNSQLATSYYKYLIQMQKEDTL
jgi:hypothetical protein